MAGRAADAEFGVLGPLEVAVGGRAVTVGSAQLRTLLAALVVQRGAVVPADRLVEVLWGDQLPPGAGGGLTKVVYRLRTALAAAPDGSDRQLIVTRSPGYVLEVPCEWVDAGRFELLLRQAQATRRAGDNPAALRLFDEALGLWRGPALVEFSFEEFARGEAARLDELRLVATEEWVDVRLALGDHERLVGDLEGLVGAHPFRERLWAQLMLALYRAERHTEALRAFGRLKGLLGDELGIEPSASLRSLEEAILLQKPELDWTADVATGPSESLVASAAIRPPGTAVILLPEGHGSFALPAELATFDGPFVGRGTELGWLEVLWDRTVVAGSQLALLAGDAGMGKTRLAAHFARRVHAGGAPVVYASCDDGQPRHFRRAGQALLRAVTASSGGSASADGDTPRVVEEALADLAAAGPVLVVLDDLDRAGPDSLAFLQHLASTPSPAPVLVVGLSRHGLQGLQPGAWAQPGDAVHWRQLPGLAVAEVGDLLAVVAGEPGGPDLAAAVHAETGGNPSVVAQFARRRRDDQIAGRVEEAISRADAARQGLQSVHDVIANGVLHHRLRHPGSDILGGAAGRCPYKGLARFEAADADYFCGRERLVAALIARLAVERFVAVIGASGSGKSSLLGAGLLPALAGGALPGSERWPTVVFRPGRDPRASVAAALAGLFGQPPDALRESLSDPEALGRLIQAALGASGRRLVLVVDQFEEVFTACRDPQAAMWLTELIVGGAADAELPIATVLAVRADYVGACTAYPELAALLAGSQLLIGAMSDPELRRAVTEPARRVGLVVEDGLVDAVCRDGRSEPGALPLVSTALLETWSRRHDDVLTLGAYLEAGGVRGALARLAEEAYQALSPADQPVARRILLRLAEPGAGLDDVRRRAPRAELDGIAGAEAVLATLVARRLVTADDTTVEVAHEALLREWPRLRTWLEDDREGRRRHRHLTETAAAWEAGGRDPAGLYRSTPLAAAQEWVSVHPEDANARELEFIDASLKEQDAELRSARRTARRLRRLTLGVALVAVVALVAGGVALVQRSNADQKAAAARRAATAADAARLAATAQALPTNQLDLAMLLAVQGRHLQQSATTDGALEAVLVHTPPGLDRTIELGAPAACGQLSFDGRLLASTTLDGYTHLIDVASGRTLRTFPNIVDSRRCPPLLFSADGDRLVASGTTGDVVVWDTATGREITTIKLPVASVRYAMYAFEPRPGRLVTATGDGTVILWDTTDVARPTRAAVFHAPATYGIFAAVSLADSAAPNRIAISNFDHTDVWNIATHTLAYPALPGRVGTESPDGSTMVTQTATQFLFWDVATGKPRRVSLAGIIPDPSWPPVFSHDGARLAVLDRTTHSVVVVDLASRRLLASIPVAGFGGPGEFLKDGRLSVFVGQTITLWRIGVTSPAPFATPIGPPATPAYAYFTPDGSKVLTLGPSGLHTWDPTTGAALPPLLGGRFDAPTQISNPVWPSFSPDGALIAWGSRNGMVTVWDGHSGQRLGALASGTANFDVAWAPRGHVVAVGGPGGGTTLWSLSDPAHPVRLAHMTAPGFPPDDTPRPLFSPDGRLLAAIPFSSQPFSDEVTLFDASSGRLERTIQTATGAMVSADFSPDSRTLATNILDFGSGTSRLVLWDIATGRARTTLFVPYVMGQVAFVAGGRWLATPQVDIGASVNGEAAGSAQVDLWDTTTLLRIGEPLHVPGDAALFLETGHAPYRLALGTTAPNGTPTILDLDPAHWQTLACRLAGRNLTRAEWDQYLPGRSYQTTCPQWSAGT
jgi:DNA-binding SARP family transcriptional activator/WD40 repeat protein